MSHFKQYFVVEFSLSQRCFHKHTVEQMLETNQFNMMKRKQTDYIPVGIFPTNELADNFISEAKEVVKDYSMYTGTDGKTMVNWQ